MSFPQMDSSLPRQLIGSEIHGFRTMEDLDFMSMLTEAKARWLRPNEIHAVLTNYKHFNILVKPLTLPASGAIVLFDRKMLRNFRKDGHNWKKKKDGKTVKEAHEHLKVGNEERIHVYYAHGEDNTTFVRRCYWLLDKKLDHIVLVHYRETQESKGAPVTPIYSSPSSALSEPSIWSVSEDSESVVDPASYTNQNSHIQANDSMTITNHVMRLHEINTLEWDDLVVPNDPKNLIPVQHVAGKSSFERQNPYQIDGYGVNDQSLSANGLHSTTNFNAEDGLHLDSVAQMISNAHRKDYSGVRTAHTNNPLQSQDSFGRWMSSVIIDSPGSVEDTILGSQISTHNELFTSPLMHQPSILGQVFNITDVSPIYALSTEETKILVVGSFYEGQSSHLIKSTLFCVCGSVCVPVEIIQNGVFRCFITPQAPGLVDLFLSFDGNTPISQVMSFEFRAPISSEQKFDFKELQVQMRLAHLLFTTSKILNVVSTKVAPSSLKQAIKFAHKTSHISDTWVQLMKSMDNSQLSFPKAKENLFELTLQSRLHEWLLERVVEGCKISERDEQGQGVIHLCAILGYTWAIYPFAWAGLSLDHRDKFGWTALHWAAYYGREKFAAILLSAGAKSYLVTDPTSEKPGGFTAADLASNNDFNGLAAYLAEKALVNHFEDMQIAGNAGGSLQTMTEDTSNTGNVNEEELYLKDSLAAYRTAADAAARIQASFRENSFKMRSKAVRSYNPEDEARGIIAAMKIQHAFRNFEMRKKMAAAVRIQYRFRTWKIRKDFINMRRQTIKIQAAFRGFQSRKTYTRIVWSVGVLEKAILRWRLKRKGFRGLQVESDEVIDKRESDVEEDFFHAGRKQAEERVEGSVVKVQALFRSKKAQEEYRRMKLAHNQAMAEYEGFQNPDTHMGYKT